MVISIYLAGKIPKGDEITTFKDWRVEVAELLLPSKLVTILSPHDPKLDEGKPTMVFGHDCYFVRECDVLAVDASTKLGAGTAQEMVIAKYFRKLVFTVLPPNTHHRRANLEMYDYVVQDWKHPFVYSMSDKIFDSWNALSTYLLENIQNNSLPNPKDLSFIDDAIEGYLNAEMIKK